MDSSSAAQGRDGRKDHQRRTGNDPQGPTGRSGGSYTPSAAHTAPRRKLTIYNVLAERVVRSDVGDIAFVLLDSYEARTPQAAKRAAARDFGLSPSDNLVAVSGRYWK